MPVEPEISHIAEAIGSPHRIRMLTLLMSGRAATAKELAYGVGVTPGTATSHLRKLLQSGLIAVRPQGRHKYFQLASPHVANCVESLLGLAPERGPTPGVPVPLRRARYCYDHLAGALGTAITDALVRRRLIRAHEAGFVPTKAGRKWLEGLGIDVAGLEQARRKLAPRCLDWSERRDHIGGALGAALATWLCAGGYIKRRPGTREVLVTSPGERILAKEFGVTLAPTQP